MRLNRLEWMLIGTSTLALAAARLFTCWNIVEDRETSQQSLHRELTRELRDDVSMRSAA